MDVVRKDELPTLARAVLAKLPETGERAALVALVGELGAGKTTFVQALGRELGIEVPMQSPTYVLMKRYRIAHGRFTTLIHIDAYRLEGAAQLAALRPEEFLEDPHALVLIEWPERVEGALPAPDVVVRFSAEGLSEDEREIAIE